MIRKKSLPGDSKVKLTFVLPEDDPRVPTSVVGDFNGWDPHANPLRRRSNRTYSATVVVDEGSSYTFRYLGEGGRWFDEESCDGRVPNGHGSSDCVVVT